MCDWGRHAGRADAIPAAGPFRRAHYGTHLNPRAHYCCLAGVAGGATRAALTQHFALRGNAADVSAKEQSQVRAVG